METVEGSAEVHFAQKLASNEKKIRDRAMKRLQKYLSLKSSHGAGLSDDDFLKIWKGLFYCMWMQDKPLIQEELSKRITSLMGSFPKIKDALRFVKIFLATHAREWNGIDKLRLDKFMLMIRDMLHQTFSLLSQAGWPMSECRSFSSSLSETVMQPEESRLPDGLRLHIADIFVEELRKVSLSEMTTAKLVTLLKPFINYIIYSKKNELVQRIMSCVICEAINTLCPTEKGDNPSEDEPAQRESKTKVTAGEESEEEEEEHLSGEEQDMEVDTGGQESTGDVTFKLDVGLLLLVMFRLAQKAEVRAANRSAVYGLVRQHPGVLQDMNGSEGSCPMESADGEDISHIFLDDGQAKDQTDASSGQRKKRRRKKAAKRMEQGGLSDEGVATSPDGEVKQIVTVSADIPQSESQENVVGKKKKKQKKVVSSSVEHGGGVVGLQSQDQSELQHEQSQVCLRVSDGGDSIELNSDSSTISRRGKRKLSSGGVSELLSADDDSVEQTPDLLSVQQSKRQKLSCEGDAEGLSVEAAVKKKKKKAREDNSAAEDVDVSVPTKTETSRRKQKGKAKKSQEVKADAGSPPQEPFSPLTSNTNANAKPKGSRLKVESVQLVRYPQTVPGPSGQASVVPSPSAMEEPMSETLSGDGKSAMDSSNLEKSPISSQRPAKQRQKKDSMSSESRSPTTRQSLYSDGGGSPRSLVEAVMASPGALVKKAVAMVAPASDPGPIESKPSGPPGQAMTPGTKKKVVFDLRKNKANKFQDYLKSLATQATPPYEPSKSPSQSILKPLPASPALSEEEPSDFDEPSGKTPKRRASAPPGRKSSNKKGKKPQSQAAFRSRSPSPAVANKRKQRANN